MELGGGGHEFSAGLSLQATLDKTVEAVVKRIETQIIETEKAEK